MSKKIKISRDSLPTQSPLGLLAVVWLLMQHFGATDIAYGVFWTIAVLMVLTFIYGLCTEKQVPVEGFHGS